MKVVAILAVRNESKYLESCLINLYDNGVETYLIDNQSTDNTLDIAKEFLGSGVLGVDTLPYKGYFDLEGQLRYKEELMGKINADWFIHMDADEVREPPAGMGTLSDAIKRVDSEGFNAINFDEFVFLPTIEDGEYEYVDYFQDMRYYYFFEPGKIRQVKAWKNQGVSVDLTSTGGHRMNFRDMKIYPQSFIMRHYIALGRDHAINKYTKERVYSEYEVNHRRWHGARASFVADKLKLPSRAELKCLDVDGWDKSTPWLKHTFLGG